MYHTPNYLCQFQWDKAQKNYWEEPHGYSFDEDTISKIILNTVSCEDIYICISETKNDFEDY